MIDKATVKRILDAADIVEVVSEYVHLTRRGANYMGLCPFHNEKTPSFSVNRARGYCHCFSCGKGGSPVGFIMEKEGIGYHDALLQLAKKYGIKVEERQLTDKERQLQSLRESMYIVSEYALTEMEKNLHSTPDGQNIALRYLYGRGITAAAIKRFRLAYALDRPADIYTRATQAGHSTQALTKTGICGTTTNGRNYDRFRARIIFPIFSPSGKTIAFGGRAIKGEPAKYVNSPESEIYHKSNELYGLYQAKAQIIKQNKCYLVEGYMDVISFSQAGIENTVASSGTSLTQQQIALIHRFTPNITLIYDGDAAGIKASLRAVDMLLQNNLNVSILPLPEGEDPDSLSQKLTPEQLQTYIKENETDFINFKTQKLLATTSADNPQQRSLAIKSIINSIASVPDMIKRSVYIQQCSLSLGLSAATLTQAVAQQLTEIKKQNTLQQRHQQIDNTIDNIADNIADTEPQTDATEVEADNEQQKLLLPVEHQIIRYAIRYGMKPFCQALCTDDETKDHEMNVIQYIAEELRADNITLTDPLNNKIYNKIIDLQPEFNTDLKRFTATLDKQIQISRQQQIDRLAQQQLNPHTIETAEQKIEQQLNDKKQQQIDTFTQAYIGSALASDPDTQLRNLVVNMIIDQYQLSKYHSRGINLPTEADRLDELLPRAMAEYKDKILMVDFLKTQQLLRQSQQQGDSQQTALLMSRLQQIADLRRQFALHIGERIVGPKL